MCNVCKNVIINITKQKKMGNLFLLLFFFIFAYAKINNHISYMFINNLVYLFIYFLFYNFYQPKKINSLKKYIF